MDKSTQRIVSPAIRFLNLSLVLALALLSGCSTADVITYSRDAQRAGEKHFRDGNYADAAGAFRNSVRQNPQNYEGYYYLGASYEKLNQYQQAMVAYKTARQTIGLSLQGKYDHDFRYKILDGLASAIAHGEGQSVETDAAQRDAEAHGTADSWYLMGKTYAIRGDADSALDAYNRSLLLEPDNFHVAREYGLYLERVGQNDKAVAPLRRAYSLKNDDKEVTAALRRIGIVPGPSLRDRNTLAEPLVPKGPIPELPTPNQSGNRSASPSVGAPRD